MSIEGKRTTGYEAWEWKIAQPRGGRLNGVFQREFIWLLSGS